MSKYPILFEANETEFKTHGIGVLSDAVQCDVTEELNGIFELTMLYPSTGKYLKELKNNRLIYADASRELGNQPFRICRVTKLLNGLVNVYAQHISYDLGGIQLPPFETLGTSDGLRKVKTYSTTQNDYSFSTSMTVDESDENNSFSTKTPKSVRAYLLGEKESFLQAYGGEFTFDRYNVRHASKRGSDKGFRVKYGVNLVDLNQEESIEKTYTGIYPYYKDEYMFMDLTESYDLMYPHEVDTSKLAGKVMKASGTFAHTKIANVDLSPYFEVAPLATDELKEVAEKYLKDNGIGVPTVSLDVRFESLRNSPEYSNVVFLEDVFLGDTIHVDFVKLGVSASGRINTIIYDALRHKNKRVSVGDAKSNVADTLISITNSVKGSETNILGVSRSVAKIDLATSQNAASIGLLVETQEDGKPSVKGSVLVDAINGQSTATISADKVNLNGYVTVNSLKADGTTVIDGSRIQTGQIISKNFLDEYELLVSYSEELSSGSYYVEIEIGYKYCNFNISNSIPSGCQIRFYEEQLKIEIYNPEIEEIIETVSCTISETPGIGLRIDSDSSIFFSESGTKIDLESGTFISKQFSITNQGAYFGGLLNVNSGRIGDFSFSKAGLYTKKSADNSFAAFGVGGFQFSSNVGGSSYVSARFGEFSGISFPPYTNQNRIELKNTNGEMLEITLTTAKLTGSWQASPYTDLSASVSEIVTKQDLINLGLITA